MDPDGEVIVLLRPTPGREKLVVPAQRTLPTPALGCFRPLKHRASALLALPMGGSSGGGTA